MQRETCAQFMPLPPRGVLVDTQQSCVAETSGLPLERLVDTLWSRRALDTVSYPGAGEPPLLVAFADSHGNVVSGLVLRPVDVPHDGMPVIAHLAAILVRLIEQHAPPAAALVEVALAMRLAHGEPVPEVLPLAGARKLTAWQCEQAVAFMDARMADGFTTADVAAQCDMPSPRFSVAFRLSFGASIRQWVIQRRVALAQRMLASESISLEAVAAACGFGEQCHFTRQFSRAVGVPPGAWRRRQQMLAA